MDLKRSAYAAALALSGFFWPLFAQTPLTADRAVALAVQNNLSLQRTKITADAKKRAADRAWNELIPAVSASSAASKYNAANSDWTATEKLSASLSLSPAVFTAMKQTKVDYEAGAIDYESAKKSLELSTRKSFNQLLLFKAQIEVYERKIETAKSQYDQTAAKAKVGQAPQLEVLSAQVAWETLKPNLRSAIVSYEDALDQFKLYIGLPVGTDLELAGSLDTSELESFLKANPVAGLSRLGDPDSVSVLRKSKELATVEKKAAAESAYLPTLALAYSAAPTYANDEWNDSGSFSATLSLKLDSFLPWSTTKETLDKYDDSIATYDSRIAEAQRSSEATIRSLKRSIEASLSKIDALVLNVTLAEKSYANYEEAYRRGTSDLQSLKDSGDALIEARASVLTERHALLDALLDLESELNLPFGDAGGAKK